MRRLLIGCALAAVLGGCVIAWHAVLKPLPPGLSIETPPRAAREVRFIADLTYVDGADLRQVDQAIFDELFDIVRGARQHILLDMFLFNAFQGSPPEETRRLCAELTEALILQKSTYPEIDIVVITDPINTVYGGHPAPHLEALRREGVVVVATELDPLRDSNWLYSSIWRWFIRPFGGEGPGLFPNPFGGERVSLRSDLRLLNFKANHRKTIVADSPTGWVALVTSANPHDASSAHGNLAIRFDGSAVADLLESEHAVMRLSGRSTPVRTLDIAAPTGDVTVRIVTEGKIGSALDATIAAAQRGDEIDVAVFYLSDRKIIRGLVDAHERQVSVRVLLDPNKDAFGLEKSGIPNRPVAAELHRAGIPVRWCDTHGEQCHAKMLLLRRADQAMLIAGSANFTRRNLRDLNLETNVWVSAPAREPVMRAASSYFERVWGNEPGRQYSVAYEAYADESWRKWWLYRAGELSGIGTY